MRTLPHWLYAVILSIVVMVGIVVFQATGTFERMEYATLDWRFLMRAEYQHVLPDPRVVLIGIDDASVRTEELGAWPFRRRWHAAFLNALSQEEPAVVAWDIIFSDKTAKTASPEKTQDVDEDAFLSRGFELASQHAAIVSAAYLSGDRADQNTINQAQTKPFCRIEGNPKKLLYQSQHAQVPLPELQASSKVAFVNCEPSGGGVHRFVPMIVSYQNQIYPSLSLQSIISYFHANPDEVDIRLGKEIVIPSGNQHPTLHIPINEEGCLHVNYRHNIKNFYSLGYYQSLCEFQAKERKEPYHEERLKPLHGAICVVGLSGTGIGDTGSVPLHENTPLVSMHLNAINNILTGDYLVTMPAMRWFPLYAFYVFVVAWGVSRFSFVTGIVFGLMSIPVYGALTYLLFLHKNLVIPAFLPVTGLFAVITAVTARRFFGEQRDKLHVKKSLAPYLSEHVLREILANPDCMRLGGQKRNISVMFCDIRGFTAFCDRRDPDDVLEVLNEYLDAMTAVIVKYDGTLDKYIGDAIMAYWGAPQDQPDHAQRAVCAAIEMRYALSEFKSKRAGQHDLFDCGIGISTGEALYGNIGSERFKNYTVIGSTVNLAARLEAATKFYNCRILISESTRSQIEGDFTITSLGDFTPQGLVHPVVIYSVEAAQDIHSALDVGRKLAQQASASGKPEDENLQPIFQPAPIPEDDPENG